MHSPTPIPVLITVMPRMADIVILLMDFMDIMGLDPASMVGDGGGDDAETDIMDQIIYYFDWRGNVF
jgi:hypothetical protein